MLIRIIPVGIIPGNIINAVRSTLPDIVGAKCRILAQLEFPKESFNHWRKQYDAEKILKIVSKAKGAMFIDKDVPCLFVAAEDIYYQNLNFVFGLEEHSVSCCLVSIARLKPEFYKKKPNITILVDRTVKECVHEIGHYLGLAHCPHPFCVMSFSACVEDVDKKQKYFCKDCKVKGAMHGFNLE